LKKHSENHEDPNKMKTVEQLKKIQAEILKREEQQRLILSQAGSRRIGGSVARHSK
jgi:hypothetical protein